MLVDTVLVPGAVPRFEGFVWAKIDCWMVRSYPWEVDAVALPSLLIFNFELAAHPLQHAIYIILIFSSEAITVIYLNEMIVTNSSKWNTNRKEYRRRPFLPTPFALYLVF